MEQNEKEIEIFVFDDGSTDGSVLICENLAKKDKRIFFEKGSNGNCTAKMNQFIHKAKGKYIAFVDHDDFISSTYFSDMIDAIEKTDVDCAIGSYCVVDENGHQLNWYSPNLQHGQILDQKAVCRLFLTTPDVEGFRWNKIFKHEVYQKNNILFEDVFAGDILMTFNLFLNIDQAVLVNNSGYYYRQSSNSMVAANSATSVKFDGFISMFERVSKLAIISSYKKEGIYYRTWRYTNFLFGTYRNKNHYSESEWSRIIEICIERDLISRPFFEVVAVLMQYFNKKESRTKFLAKAIITYIFFTREIKKIKLWGK